MSVDVYLLDSNWVFETKYDPNLRTHIKGNKSVLTSVPSNAITVIATPGDNMENVVAMIKNALGKKKLGTLYIGSHGLPQQILIGKGMKLDNCGAFGDLAGDFHDTKRVIRIFGCGVASDTALRPDPMVAVAMKAARKSAELVNAGANLGMIGSWHNRYNSSDNGYQLVKALANITRAGVQACINVSSNMIGDTFKYIDVRTVWVYPDNEKDQEKYTYSPCWFSRSYLVKHNDFVLIRYNSAGDAIDEIGG